MPKKSILDDDEPLPEQELSLRVNEGYAKRFEVRLRHAAFTWRTQTTAASPAGKVRRHLPAALQGQPAGCTHADTHACTVPGWACHPAVACHSTTSSERSCTGCRPSTRRLLPGSPPRCVIRPTPSRAVLAAHAAHDGGGSCAIQPPADPIATTPTKEPTGAFRAPLYLMDDYHGRSNRINNMTAAMAP